jgi:hypothetical protein
MQAGSAVSANKRMEPTPRSATQGQAPVRWPSQRDPGLLHEAWVANAFGTLSEGGTIRYRRWVLTSR